MRKIEKFIKCNDFNVALVGKGKNQTVYFLFVDVCYPENDFDSEEVVYKVGVNEKFIEEPFFKMSLKTFKNFAKVIK